MVADQATVEERERQRCSSGGSSPLLEAEGVDYWIGALSCTDEAVLEAKVIALRHHVAIQRRSNARRLSRFVGCDYAALHMSDLGRAALAGG